MQGDLLSGEMQRRLPLIGLLVDFRSVVDQRGQNVHLSFARGIVNRIAAIRVALIEQHLEIVAFE